MSVTDNHRGRSTTEVSDGEDTVATRLAIIRAAVDRFAMVGYAGTSIRDIAREVGIQPASIYSHFPSKEEILWCAYRQAMDQLASMQAEATPTDAGLEGRVRAFVRTHALFHATHSRLAQVSNSQMVSLNRAHYDQAAQWRDDYERMFRNILLQGVDSGAIALPDPKIYSYAILQMGMSIALWYRPDGQWSAQEIAGHHEEIALRMLGLDADGEHHGADER